MKQEFLENLLTESEIRRFLGETVRVGKQLCCFSELDSTNQYAKQLAQTGAADGTVITADCQTAGRGRMGRSFQSPAGKSISLSVLLWPTLPPAALPPVTAMAAVAMCDAIEDVCGLRPGIKWTNDLVLNGKKLCGILTELLEVDGHWALVLGIGLNVSQREADFQGEVTAMATSLELQVGHPVCRAKLAAAEIRALDRLDTGLRMGQTEAYLERYREDCVTLGKTVQLVQGCAPHEIVTAVDVDEEYGLLVRDACGMERVIRSGEVSVRGMYGYVE